MKIAVNIKDAFNSVWQVGEVYVYLTCFNNINLCFPEEGFQVFFFSFPLEGVPGCFENTCCTVFRQYPVEMSENQWNVLEQDLGFAYMLISPQETEYVSS